MNLKMILLFYVMMTFTLTQKIGDKKWEAYTDKDRERTGLDIGQWAEMGANLGAGEIFVTSIDQEGTRKGFDCELVADITERADVPVFASGGFGSLDHLSQLVKASKPTGVAIADSLHYNRYSFDHIRSFCLANGISTRKLKTVVDTRS